MLRDNPASSNTFPVQAPRRLEAVVLLPQVEAPQKLQRPRRALATPGEGYHESTQEVHIMAEMNPTTATARTPSHDMASLASALISTSEGLAKVSQRIGFIGEMLGDRDQLVLSRSAFDALQGYLLETVTLANTALQDTSEDLDLALEVMNKAK